MAFASGSKGLKSDINVTPLVDVVLVLLIIFMVVTPMLQRGKDVHLPTAKSKNDAKNPEVVIISVPSDHTIWFENSLVTKATLELDVAHAIAKDPNQKIVVKGDRSLKVKDVREVMARAKSAGAKTVSLAVEEQKQ